MDYSSKMFLNTDSRLLRQIRYYLKPSPKTGGLGLNLFLLSACIIKNHVIPYGQDQRKRGVHYFNLIFVSGLFFKLICANNNTFKKIIKHVINNKLKRSKTSNLCIVRKYFSKHPCTKHKNKCFRKAGILNW